MISPNTTFYKIMKIKLHNFRCHPDGQYDFPDSGLVLISGVSGTGKSTLLKAILYALYGTKAVRKPYTFGATKCSVILEFLGMKIKRTNRPNRLTVGDLEDDTAQAFINEKLGVGFEEFMISSYVPQKNNISILSIAQTEQLRLIKTLSFDGSQNELYREKINEMIHKSSNVLVEKRANKQFIQQEISRIVECELPLVDFPLTLYDSETEEEAMKRYHTRVKLFNQRISELLEKRATLNEQLQIHTRLSSDLATATEKLAKINRKIAKLDTYSQQLRKIIEHAPSDLKDQMIMIKTKIQYLNLEKERLALQSQFDQIHIDKRQECTLQRKQIEDLLWLCGDTLKDRTAAQNEIDAYCIQLQVWEQHLKAEKRLLEVRREYDLPNSTIDELIESQEKLFDRVDTEKERLCRKKEALTLAVERVAFEETIITCPECNASLCLENKDTSLKRVSAGHPLPWSASASGSERPKYKLISVHNHTPIEKRDYVAEIKTVEQHLRGLNNKRNKCNKILQLLRVIEFPALENVDPHVYEEMKGNVKSLTLYIAQNLQREESLATLDREETANYLTPALNKIKRQITIKARVIKELSIKTMPAEDIKDLREQSSKLEKQADNYQSRTAEMAENTIEINTARGKYDSCTCQIQDFEQEISNINVSKITKTLNSVIRKIDELKKQQEDDEKLAVLVEEYVAFREQHMEIERWEQQLANVNKKLTKAEKVHTANLTLKEKYIQAEIMTLESTISSINEHTRYYLDTFFAEHQLSVTLDAIRKGKKVKTLKVDTFINYKGNEYDNIHQLSGGEFDRCTLASICGINSMLGSPILILDESLSSLDASTNTEIIRFLGQLAHEKLILICSHEAVQGIFDHIVTL